MTQGVDWSPELCVAAGRKRKRAWQNTDHRVGMIVEVDRLPHHFAARSEAMELRPIAEDHDVGTADTVLARIEIAPQHGTHSEGPEEAAAYALALDRLRA